MKESSEEQKRANTAMLRSPHGVLTGTTDPAEMSEASSASWQQTGQAKLQRTLVNIHTVAKHLLTLDEHAAEDLFVGVQPRGGTWRVEVKYAGFSLVVGEDKLSVALEQTLAKLMTHVGRRLDEATRLVAVLDPNFGRVATHDALASAVKRVAGVSEATFREEVEVGVVTVCVTPDRPMTTEERVQFVAEIGMALGKTGAAVVRFRVQVLDYFNQST